MRRSSCRFLPPFLPRFGRESGGGVTILASFAMTALLAASALAVDTAAVHLDRRRAQGMADLAALAGAVDPARAEAAVAQALADNGYTARALDVRAGRYEPDPGRPAGARFVAGAGDANAVRVRLSHSTDLVLGRIFARESVETRVEATAARAPLAAFSAGTRLASLEGGAVNAALGALLGTDISLSVMDYEALLDGRVDLFSVLDTLDTALDLQAASYEAVLDADLTLADLLEASVLALDAEGGGRAARVVEALVRQGAGEDLPLDLAAFVDPGPAGARAPGQGAGLATQVGAFDLIGAAARIAAPSRMVDLGAGLAVPGLAHVEARLAIGEPMRDTPWLAVGEEGARVHTAQTRLFVEARLGGEGLLSGLALRVPLYVEIAAGSATLSALTCGTHAGVELAARPGIAHAWLADIDPDDPPLFDSHARPAPARLLEAPLARILARAHAESGNLRAETVAFSRAEIEAGVLKTVESRDYAASLVASLFDALELEVKVGLLGLGLGGPLGDLAGRLLGEVAGPLDRLVHSVLAPLGLGLGEIDLRVNGLRCGRVALVS